MDSSVSMLVNQCISLIQSEIPEQLFIGSPWNLVKIFRIQGDEAYWLWSSRLFLSHIFVRWNISTSTSWNVTEFCTDVHASQMSPWWSVFSCSTAMRVTLLFWSLISRQLLDGLPRRCRHKGPTYAWCYYAISIWIMIFNLQTLELTPGINIVPI